MASKMLIDAAHPEETRVCVVRGNRIEEFDYESASRRPLKGNIYLAKVTRVEPSLQAAFVEYGGNRHGFLAFSEIHPDYYQIPVADRQALLEADAEDARLAREEEEAEQEKTKPRRRRSRSARSKDEKVASEPVDGEASMDETVAGEAADDEAEAEAPEVSEAETADTQGEDAEQAASKDAASADEESSSDAEDTDGEADPEAETDDDVDVSASADESGSADDDTEEEAPKPRKRTPRKNYKIQEVIKRRQVLLIQVVKEERGNKGAALTTYMSLAGRYCVLMPNTARGGGISRKITDASDRRRLKDVIRQVEVPEGMGLIVRTAGAQRTKTEIRRDYDYLLRMWESVRELTLKSAAPTLVYEEGNLIKRSIRDLYSKDIDEVVVEGEEGFREAKDFMKMLMPSHARNVKLYKDTRQLFTRHQVESQLDGLFTPNVTLPSGGYIVMNQTEALVSIDINSGKATREHSIEDTALKTNLEAAAEISRQLRLRDLAGLIVIDFIDMEENRNNRAVERKLKDALKNDRARIQVGRISHFGLLEMSRQRLRQGMMESSTMQCPHCEGTGVIRGVSSCALSVLRGIEEHLLSRKPESLDVRVHPDVAFYIFNEKRDHLLSLEENYRISIYVLPDTERALADSIIERKPDRKGPTARPVASDTAVAMGDGMEANEEPAASDDADADKSDDRRNDELQLDENGEPRKKRRRRRGRRGGRKQREERDGEVAAKSDDAATSAADEQASGDDTPDTTISESDASADTGGDDDKPKKRRRRSRGGRDKVAEETSGTESEDVAAADTQAGESVAAEADTPPAEDAEADEKPKPKKRAPRKAAKKAKADSSETATKDADDSVAKDTAEAVDSEKPAKKPRKRAAKKAKPAEADTPVETVSANGNSTPCAPAENDQAAPKWTPPAPTVNPATAPKKAGWWGKR
ncbi:MAG: Rne/Rng family ribonuclease [Anderseniella sp.]